MSLKILPKAAEPSKRRLLLKHKPRLQTRDGGYRAYLECLRWEFGFSCAFCLLHEADLVDYPIRGTGLFSIEHIVTRYADLSRQNIYENCAYACRFCNRARGYQPIEDERGRKLIAPMHVSWAEHFTALNDKLVPRTDDADFTGNKLYRVNDELKVKLRKQRREVIGKCLDILAKAPREIARYVAIARRNASRIGEEYQRDAQSALDAAGVWEARLRESREKLARTPQSSNPSTPRRAGNRHRSLTPKSPRHRPAMERHSFGHERASLRIALFHRSCPPCRLQQRSSPSAKTRAHHDSYTARRLIHTASHCVPRTVRRTCAHAQRSRVRLEYRPFGKTNPRRMVPSARSRYFAQDL